MCNFTEFTRVPPPTTSTFASCSGVTPASAKACVEAGMHRIFICPSCPALSEGNIAEE